MPPLQHHHFSSGLCQISRVGQAIVPAANDNRVIVLPHPLVSELLLNLTEEGPLILLALLIAAQVRSTSRQSNPNDPRFSLLDTGKAHGTDYGWRFQLHSRLNFFP